MLKRFVCFLSVLSFIIFSHVNGVAALEKKNTFTVEFELEILKRYLKESLLFEDDDVDYFLSRWEEDIRFKVLADTKARYNIEKYILSANGTVPLNFATSGENFNYLIISTESIETVLRDRKEEIVEFLGLDNYNNIKGPKNCSRKNLFLKNGSIKKSILLIDQNLSAEHYIKCVNMTLMLSLGFINFLDKGENSVLSLSNKPFFLSEYDFAMIHFLYSDHVKAGMAREEVLSAIEALGQK